MDKLKKVPDKVVYEVARQTLDRVGSIKITPYRTGKMERTMFQKGVVKDSSGIYTIGNYTDYAQKVYNKPQGTNWTNPNSKSKWFEWFWRTNGKSVFESTVARYKI